MVPARTQIGVKLLKVAAILQINTQQSNKIGVSDEGGVREDARLRRNK